MSVQQTLAELSAFQSALLERLEKIENVVENEDTEKLLAQYLEKIVVLDASELNSLEPGMLEDMESLIKGHDACLEKLCQYREATRELLQQMNHAQKYKSETPT